MPLITRTRLLSAAALCAALVMPAPSAQAGPPPPLDCTLNAHVVTLNLTEDHSVVRVIRSGDEIRVTSGTTFYACDGATVTNTDKIRIIDTVAGQAAWVDVDLGGGPFAPGFTNEDGTSDEIEFLVKLGDGDNRFGVQGPFGAKEGGVNLRAGLADVGETTRREVNLNAGETTHVDHDVIVKGMLFQFSLWGSGADDRISAQGGAGTGNPYRGSVGIFSSTGSDVLAGGLGDDFIFAANGKCVECFPDRDRAFGGRGDDLIRGGKANDILSGGKGSDTVEGQDGDDDLRGGDGPDTLLGGAGDDELDGGAGTDMCEGNEGADDLQSCEGGVG